MRKLENTNITAAFKNQDAESQPLSATNAHLAAVPGQPRERKPKERRNG